MKVLCTTTGETISHLTKLANYANQVIGYTLGDTSSKNGHDTALRSIRGGNARNASAPAIGWLTPVTCRGRGLKSSCISTYIPVFRRFSPCLTCARYVVQGSW